MLTRYLYKKSALKYFDGDFIILLKILFLWSYKQRFLLNNNFCFCGVHQSLSVFLILSYLISNRLNYWNYLQHFSFSIDSNNSFNILELLKNNSMYSLGIIKAGVSTICCSILLLNTAHDPWALPYIAYILVSSLPWVTVPSIVVYAMVLVA